MPELLSHHDLIEAGWSHREIVHLVRDGELRRIRRGVYRPATTPAEEETRFQQERRLHLELIPATLPLIGPGVVSHQSAALLHGLPHLSGDLSMVHLTRSPRTGGRLRGNVHLYTAGLPVDHVSVLDGVAITTVARTVLDLARHLERGQAVAVGDAARRHLVQQQDLVRVAADCRGWPGVAQARRVLPLLDPRSESVGESISRVLMHRHTVPAPDLQHWVQVADGRRFRSDFAWPALRTLGEFDGLSKYGRNGPGQPTSEAVIDEKLREDALRDAGWQVVRWIWSELFSPADFLARLRRAFVRGVARS